MAIQAGRAKLAVYNGKTEKPFGRFLNFATILDPEVKLELYRVSRLYHKTLSH